MGLMNVFGKIFSPIKKFFSVENMKKADAVADMIKGMIDYAMPAVSIVAAMTPTQADDAIIAVIKRFGLGTPTPAAGQKFDSATISGVLMQAAQVAAREKLSDAIKLAGEEGLKIGDKYIKDHTEIPDSVINAATNAVYAILKNSTKV